MQDLKKLLKAATALPWELKQNKAGHTTIGPVGYSGFITPWICDEANAALIVAAVNAVPEMIEAANRDWTSEDQTSLNSAVYDAMWSWDDVPMDVDDATCLAEMLKDKMRENGLEIVRARACFKTEAV